MVTGDESPDDGDVTTFAEAERANREYYRKLAPHQRLAILYEIAKREGGPNDDPEQRLARVIASLNSQKVEYVLIGGHAVVFRCQIHP
jgi:hypothetical protein